MREILLALVSSIIFAATNTFAADIYLWNPDNPDDMGPDERWTPGELIIEGEIVPGDYEKMILVIRESFRLPHTFSISSLGGDVATAMEMGRFFRASLMHGEVTKNAECISACFLIIVGSPARFVDAPIELHRAYYSAEYFAALSPVEAEQQYQELDMFVRSYLYEMNVPEEIIARMMATKSTETIPLRPDEFYELIGYLSPAFEEWRIARCGDYTKKEKLDEQAVTSLRFANNVTSTEYGGPTEIDKEILADRAEEIAYARTLPEEYRIAVRKKIIAVSSCRSRAVDEHRKKVFAEIKNEK